MQRTFSSIDKIRAELAWITETPDPNKCGCRNVRCAKKRQAGSMFGCGCHEVLDVPLGVLLPILPRV
jgi:hypothetical protein